MNYWLLTGAISTFLMTGVCWIIQLIQYPSFVFYDSAHFSELHAHHSKMMVFIAGPLMFLELISSLVWLFFEGLHFSSMFNALTSIGLWILTFIIFVPLHSLLQQTYSVTIAQKLVRLNWIRTALWTVRSLFFIYVLESLLNS